MLRPGRARGQPDGARLYGLGLAAGTGPEPLIFMRVAILARKVGDSLQVRASSLYGRVRGRLAPCVTAARRARVLLPESPVRRARAPCRRFRPRHSLRVFQRATGPPEPLPKFC